MQFTWIDRFEGARIDELFEMMQHEWWTSKRSLDDTRHMLRHCDLTLGCCAEDGRLAGFARVLTDYTFKAFIFDVVVHKDFRGHGVGKAIIERIVAADSLSKVTSFELYCQDDNVPFYERLGFAPKSSNLMSLTR